jgi:hypothetical protein
MKSDLKVFFASRFFLRLVFLSLSARVIFQFNFLPKSYSEFGPDEGTYADLARYVAEGLPVQEFPLYGPGLYNSARTLILPSSLLIKFGLNELFALRLISTIAGLLSLIAISLSLIAFIRLSEGQSDIDHFTLKKGQKIILFIFAFLPSNFLWSNLGLRESSSQLFLILFTYFSIKLLSPEVQRRFLYTLLAGFSLVLAFGARAETALVFSLLVLIFSIGLAWKLRHPWIGLALLIGFVGGQAFTTTPDVEAKEVLVAVKVLDQRSSSPKPIQSSESSSPKPIQSSESSSPKPIQSSESSSPKPIQSSESSSPKPKLIESSQEVSKFCGEENQILIRKSGTYECVNSKEYNVSKIDPAETVKQQILTTKYLEYKRQVNRLDANSALPESVCKISSPIILSEILCNLIDLPYRLLSFLFRPFLLIDSGSSFLNLAGVENLLWLGLIIYAALAACRKSLHKVAKFFIAWLYSYIFTFSIAASLYEGNLGTAFRHKSSILWALALGLLISHKDFKFKGRDSKLFKYRHSKKEEI